MAPRLLLFSARSFHARLEYAHNLDFPFRGFDSIDQHDIGRDHQLMRARYQTLDVQLRLGFQQLGFLVDLRL